MNKKIYLSLFWIVYGLNASFVSAVDLYLSNKTNTDQLATARAEHDRNDLTSVPARTNKIFIENITPSDTLSVYLAHESQPWGVFRITLGGQRDEAIYLNIVELSCGHLSIQDPLNESGESGYSIQILREKSSPEKICPGRI